MEAESDAILKSGSSTEITSGSTQKYKADQVDVNPEGSVPDPEKPLELPEHKHKPTKAE